MFWVFNQFWLGLSQGVPTNKENDEPFYAELSSNMSSCWLVYWTCTRALVDDVICACMRTMLSVCMCGRHHLHSCADDIVYPNAVRTLSVKDVRWICFCRTFCNIFLDISGFWDGIWYIFVFDLICLFQWIVFICHVVSSLPQCGHTIESQNLTFPRFT